MNILALRDDAYAGPGSSPGFVGVGAVMIQEHLSPNRVCALGTRTEVLLKPGTIYKAYTGLSFEGVISPAQLSVRSSADFWRAGAYVLRTEISEDGETLVFFSVMVAIDFVRRNPMFEIACLTDATATSAAPAVQAAERPAPSTAGLSLAAEGEKHIQGPPPMATMGHNSPDAPSPEVLVKQWLNEPDDKGRVVDDVEDTGERKVSTTARVSEVPGDSEGPSQPPANTLYTF